MLLFIFALIDASAAVIAVTCLKLGPLGDLVSLLALRIVWTPLLNAVVRSVLSFLVACPRLYNPLCRSVRRSVRP